MITGDHATTARNIASEAGICNAATCSQIEGSELKSKGADTLKDEIMQVNIISRADPIDKVTIIEALHHNDKLVAMTGDGVNDAPALVKADIGIAMGKNGTDAARESADMVLVDNKFSTIVNGIEQARIVFENLRKTTSYLFSTSFGEIMTIILSLIIGLPLPITAVQILWLNLITDGFLDVAIATEGKHGDLLRFSSKKYQKGIVNGLMLTRIIILGSVMAIGSIIYFEKQLTTNDLVYAQTATFIVMAMYQWFNALNARSEDNSIFAIGIFKNKFVWGALFIEVVLCLFAVYTPFMNRILGTTPVSANVWFIASLFAVLIVFIEEGRKFLFKIYKDTKADKNVLNIS
jgi:Ca2+-transporting ATPase